MNPECMLYLLKLAKKVFDFFHFFGFGLFLAIALICNALLAFHLHLASWLYFDCFNLASWLFFIVSKIDLT